MMGIMLYIRRALGLFPVSVDEMARAETENVLEDHKKATKQLAQKAEEFDHVNRRLRDTIRKSRDITTKARSSDPMRSLVDGMKGDQGNLL